MECGESDNILAQNPRNCTRWCWWFTEKEEHERVENSLKIGDYSFKATLLLALARLSDRKKFLWHFLFCTNLKFLILSLLWIYSGREISDDKEKKSLNQSNESSTRAGEQFNNHQAFSWLAIYRTTTRSPLQQWKTSLNNRTNSLTLRATSITLFSLFASLALFAICSGRFE